MNTRTLPAAVVLMAMTCCPPAHAQSDDAWHWTVVPFAWLVGVQVEAKLNGAPGGESRFPNFLDTFDGAFQGHVEGMRGAWGGFTDFTYLGLSSGRDRPGFHSEADFDTRLFELAALWRPGAQRDTGVDVFAGLRYIDLDFTGRLFPTNPQLPYYDHHIGRSYSDFMVGARYTWALSDRWGLTVRADGSWGQTDGTWGVSGVVRYRTQNGEWLFGYRHLDAELGGGSGDGVMVDVDGPEIGYGFRF